MGCGMRERGSRMSMEIDNLIILTVCIFLLWFALCLLCMERELCMESSSYCTCVPFLLYTNYNTE